MYKSILLQAFMFNLSDGEIALKDKALGVSTTLDTCLVETVSDPLILWFYPTFQSSGSKHHTRYILVETVSDPRTDASRTAVIVSPCHHAILDVSRQCYFIWHCLLFAFACCRFARVHRCLAIGRCRPVSSSPAAVLLGYAATSPAPAALPTSLESSLTPLALSSTCLSASYELNTDSSISKHVELIVSAAYSRFRG
ncbi:hypothetical protein J6590_087975 [Homalodisca vitripennis]|nr:hypothetical protein J6590_087975 [Homalodisca vitripennis]